VGLFGKKPHEIIDYIEYGPEFIVRKTEDDVVEGLVRLESEWN
jgi:hypothetical protein